MFYSCWEYFIFPPSLLSSPLPACCWCCSLDVLEDDGKKFLHSWATFHIIFITSTSHTHDSYAWYFANIHLHPLWERVSESVRCVMEVLSLTKVPREWRRKAKEFLLLLLSGRGEYFLSFEVDACEVGMMKLLLLRDKVGTAFFARVFDN
jgi:hypothetical protein